jgi:hypothetical protein
MTIASTLYAFFLESIKEGRMCPPACFIFKNPGCAKMLVNDVQ